MTTLLANLPLPEKRRDVIDDCVRLLDAEVKRKKGLTGLAIKAGYRVLKAFKPGAVPEAVDGLLDDFLASLEPLYADHDKAGGFGSFGTHMKRRTHDVAEALLGVTDRRADGSRHRTLVKGYRKLRPSALRNVEEAVPGLADLFDKHIKESKS